MSKVYYGVVSKTSGDVYENWNEAKAKIFDEDGKVNPGIQFRKFFSREEAEKFSLGVYTVPEGGHKVMIKTRRSNAKSYWSTVCQTNPSWNCGGIINESDGRHHHLDELKALSKAFNITSNHIGDVVFMLSCSPVYEKIKKMFDHNEFPRNLFAGNTNHYWSVFNVIKNKSLKKTQFEFYNSHDKTNINFYESSFRIEKTIEKEHYDRKKEEIQTEVLYLAANIDNVEENWKFYSKEALYSYLKQTGIFSLS